jgi:hypothetical protein
MGLQRLDMLPAIESAANNCKGDGSDGGAGEPMPCHFLGNLGVLSGGVLQRRKKMTPSGASRSAAP